MEKLNQSPVKQLREKAGVSQRQLASALGVHHSLIANLEEGYFEISDKNISKKAEKIFNTLADWCGLPKEKLINMQVDFTKQLKVLLKEDFQKIISQQAQLWITKKVTGSASPDGKGTFILIDYIKSELNSKSISPITWFREQLKASQRQFALSCDVPQTAIARLEIGEININNPTAKKVFTFMADALGIIYEPEKEYHDPEKPHYLINYYSELWDTFYDCQLMFMENTKKISEEKVKNALREIKLD